MNALTALPDLTEEHVLARPRNLADMKALQTTLKIKNRKALLAMSARRDPFNCGGPADERDAEWFAEQWKFHGFTDARNVHLRKLHYRIVALGEDKVQLPRPVTYEMDGKQVIAGTYRNDIPVWKYLTEAGARARYLGLVSPDAFVDRRNPKPTIIAKPFWEAEPEWWFGEFQWTLPKIRIDLASDLDWYVPFGHVDGYDYSESNQPYLLEVWCEKSTMDEVLEPICQRMGANYVTAKGFQSITAAINILHRAKQCAMPTRILYISDFDPAGDKMAPAIARQVEFWFERYAPDVEVKMDALVLTPEQIQQWSLPMAPIKGSDKRAASFMERYGVAGAVELDALDTLHPGVLDSIVIEAMSPYRDSTLPKRLQDAEKKAQRAVNAAIEPVRHAAASVLSEIRSDASTILSRYQARVEALATDLAADFVPIQERLDDLRDQITADLRDVVVPLPARPVADIVQPDESRWLFDSTRDYLAQLDAYRSRYPDLTND